MSTGIVRSMSINLKNKKQTFSVASSNVFPRTYNKAEVTGVSERLKDKKYDILTENEKFVYSLVSDLSGGMIRLNKTVNVKYRYAFYKMIEKRNEIFNNNKELYTDNYGASAWYVLYDEINGVYNLHNVKKVLNAFIQALEIKDTKINKAINFEYGYVFKITPNNFEYTRDIDSAKKYNSQKTLELDILELSSKFSKYNFNENTL